MRHASLFSGIGAAEIAAEMLGWENIFHCEINPFGSQVLKYWFPNSDSYEDIKKTNFKRYRRQIDVLTGGFPCQPFSYAGKRGGKDDDRYLWPEMLRVIDEIRPTWVVGENVAGIATMVESCEITDMGGEASLFEEGDGVHRFRAEHTFTIERICRDLESKGYSVQPMLIPACAVGAPHRRDRVFIIAHNTDSCHDVRESCEHEGEGGEERVSERHSVRKSGESDNVRSETEGTFTDSKDVFINGGEAGYGGNGLGKKVPKLGGGDSQDAAHAIGKGLERQDESRSGEGGQWMHIWRDSAGCCRKDGLKPENRWRGFPTVSAVHRGNDGLPFDVDNLTIPFARWRNESLKAYGNAIVPQVMYRIFQCIESLNNNQNHMENEGRNTGKGQTHTECDAHRKKAHSV